MLTFSSSDKHLSGCPKQGILFWEKSTLPQSPVPSAEHQSVSEAFPGEKWLLWGLSGVKKDSKVFASLYMQMHSDLPAAVPEQVLHWRWLTAPAGESLGDGPGACCTFLLPWRLVHNNWTSDDPIRAGFRCNLASSTIFTCDSLFVQTMVTARFLSTKFLSRHVKRKALFSLHALLDTAQTPRH